MKQNVKSKREMRIVWSVSIRACKSAVFNRTNNSKLPVSTGFSQLLSRNCASTDACTPFLPLFPLGSLQQFKSYLVLSINLCSTVLICGMIFFFSSISYSQRFAILTPEKTAESERFTETFENSLAQKFKVIDLSLAESILRIKKPESVFNLTVQDAKNLGVSIGCNYFIIIKTDILRRTDFGRDKYFESYSTFYLVSSRTGRLVFWLHKKFDEDTPEQAKTKLFASIKSSVVEISDQIAGISKTELNEEESDIKEIPEASSSEAKGLRPPLPYNRIKPKYTTLAALYSIIATVDILVDVDENGIIVRTEIVRWAGFGLDESVIETVKEMNWRPADRNGKTMPMRVLLRYNFRNIETD